MNEILKRLIKTIGICLLDAFGIWVLAAPVNGCLPRYLTGIPCPSCGMTRAFFSLVQFKFAAAFHYHPLIYFLLPVGAFVVARYIFYGILPTDKRYIKLYVLTIFLFVAVWIIRLCFFNIP